MAKQVLVLEEVLAMLTVVGAAPALVEKFRLQAEAVLRKKPERSVVVEGPLVTGDHITVSSGHGQASGRGFVELTLEEVRTQMDAAKAREVGLMLIEAAEAAISDEIFLKLLAQVGVDDLEQRGRILLDLRELRQGTRGVSWPT